MSGIDFGLLGDGSATAGVLLHPRDVFNALPARAPGLDYLRGPQDQVLDAWFQRRAQHDVVIKMNTGGGKTVVGLLIAQSCLNEKVGPVAYLVHDRYLEAQVTLEAARLGISVTNDPRSGEYNSGRAVLVDTFQKLFNGLSVFGVAGSSGKPPQHALGTVLVDDAHACLARAEEEFKLKIHSSETAYQKVLDLFKDVLDNQSPTSLLDIQAGRHTGLLQIPHWSWADRQSQVLPILHPLADVKPHMFAWPLLADILPICRAVMTSEWLEISPTCLPVDRLVGFARAERRVYLTATLADDGVLVTDFDADPAAVTDPIVPANAGDIGDRLILMPQHTHPDASEDEIRDLVVSIAEQQNTVVIVPSEARSLVWAPHAALVLNKDSLAAGVDAMKANPRLGLVVLVNRYDGIDLPGDACHVLVLDGLPEAVDPTDRLDEAQLSGSDALLHRQIQRIEQGMGRAVRSNDDYCVVLLLGPRLTERLHRPRALDAFSPATRAQILLSQQAAEQLEGNGLASLREAVSQVLSRAPGWIGASRSRLATLRYEPAHVDDITVARRRAFDLAANGEYALAAEALEPALDVADSDKPRKGQLLQELSQYQHPIDPVKAQQTQQSANRMNRGLLRPLNGANYDRLNTPTQEQGSAASTWLQAHYATAGDLSIGFAALVADLTFSPRTEAFERAMADLALHIGWSGQRPEHDTGRGPDVLWAQTGGTFLVIEAKSGNKEHVVYKADAEQLSNATDWFQNTYPGMTYTPVLVHPWAKFDKQAAVPVGCRVVTTEKLAGLREGLGRLTEALTQADAFRDPRKVGQLLASQNLTTTDFLTRYSTGARPGV